jgi:molybdopterin-guanine dinucleotide biosynthesis protein A
MEKTAVILAGGFSRRFGQDKGTLRLLGKPLIRHILDRVSAIVDQTLVVVSSKNQKTVFKQILSPDVEVIQDAYNVQSPLVGALTGFRNAKSRYCILLPCDTPLVSTHAISLLLNSCVPKEAAIPRWPNKFIEPLQAAYCTKPALAAAENALRRDEQKMQSMIQHLNEVNYISITRFKEMDPDLLTFLNINTPNDMKKIEKILEKQSKHSETPLHTCVRRIT